MVLLRQHREYLGMKEVNGRFPLCKMKSGHNSLAYLQDLAKIERIEAFLQFIGQIEGGDHLLVKTHVVSFCGVPPSHNLLESIPSEA